MSAKIRVMVVTTVPQTMAAFFPRQLAMLADAGFDVHAVSSPGAELDRFSGDGITTHGIPMERPVSPRRDIVSLFRLVRLMLQLRPDVVHVHTPKAGLLGMIAARLAGVPVRLYTVHGLPLMTRTGLLRRVLEAAERLSSSLSTRTYFVSPSLQQEVVDLGLCPRHKAFTLGAGSCSGIDLNRFRPGNDSEKKRSELGIGPDAMVATFIGRLAKDKGIGVLAEAWPLVIREFPQMRLVLAGEADATDPIAPEVMTRLEKEPSVISLGGVAREEIPSLYEATDICVLPTFREGLSQVALESGAMGVPIVSSNVSGLVDSVVNGVTGILVEPRNPGALAAAICRLAASAELRAQMGRAGIEHVQTNFSEQRVNGEWMTEYRNLTASVGRSPHFTAGGVSSGGPVPRSSN